MTATLSAFESKLRAFYDREGIAVQGFKCPHRAACLRSAQQAPLSQGSEAYVGSLYGAARKVVVIAPDAGGVSGALANNREGLESPDEPEQFAPEVEGTLRLVRKILSKELEDASPAPYFALIRAAKCSAKNLAGEALPDAMHDACRPYAQSELSLLEPDVLVTQGDRTKRLLERSYPAGILDVNSLLSPANAVGNSPIFDGMTLDWLEAVSLRYLANIRVETRDVIVLHAPHPGEAGEKWRMFEQLHLPICAWLIQEQLARRKPS